MKTLTQTSNIAIVREAHQSQLQRVCQLLNWTADDYTEYQFAQYSAFITRSFEHYPVMLKQVLYSSIMRGFWNNEAAKCNEFEFLPFAELETTDASWINSDGELVFIEALPFGDRYLVDQFYLMHDSQSLKNDDAFMHLFNNTLKSIR